MTCLDWMDNCLLDDTPDWAKESWDCQEDYLWENIENSYIG